MGNTGGKETGNRERELSNGGSLASISKLYSDYDAKVVKNLILDSKLSPFFKGLSDSTESHQAECPICFLYYPDNLNLSRCCRQPLCTECFLQIRHPENGGPAVCPFCVSPEYGVIFNPGKEDEVSYNGGLKKYVKLDTVKPNGRRLARRVEPQLSVSPHYRRAFEGYPQGSTYRISQAYVRGTSSSLFNAHDFDSELERRMIMEAIRVSLQDQQRVQQRFINRNILQNGPNMYQPDFEGMDLNFETEDNVDFPTEGRRANTSTRI